MVAKSWVKVHSRDVYNEVNWKNLLHQPKKEIFSTRNKMFLQKQQRTITTATTTPSRQKSHLILFFSSFKVNTQAHTMQHCHFCFRRDENLLSALEISILTRADVAIVLACFPSSSLFRIFLFISFFPHHSRKLKLQSLKRGTRTYIS